MPYIDLDRKLDLVPKADDTPASPGELNFLFTVIALQYLADEGESYQTYNDIIGALEGAKLELYRRSISKYEDKKIKENGDVYPETKD